MRKCQNACFFGGYFLLSFVVAHKREIVNSYSKSLGINKEERMNFDYEFCEIGTRVDV